ncbi:thiamine-phosphate kinase [Methanobacterium sp. ACI-7]|uniref:thiamine-phosphate kinase n=1 Tax=unclassified Methanobacterium TaxID=2627676 RepID=UPI0039C4863D
MPLKVSDIGEKGLIKRILNKSRSKVFTNSFFDDKAIKSLNDDAALIDFGDKYLVATSDILFQSAHFPDIMTPEQIGEKVVAVNVSDLAAMGAKPLGIIIAVGLPSSMLLEDFDNLIDGILEGCSKYEMLLIGGDTNEAKELTLSATCLGIARKDEVLMKEGANPGDIVAVTGPLGLAAAGFEILLNPDLNADNLSEEHEKIALKHALNPEARVKEGLLLAKSGFISSATDITDGLASEIGELINSSPDKIGITIYEEKLHIDNSIIEIAKKVIKDPLEFVLYYGEDFEILFTIKREAFNQINNEIKACIIGEVNSSGKMTIVHKDGTEKSLEPRGYEHLTKKV